jgi:hypothetical protein
MPVADPFIVHHFDWDILAFHCKRSFQRVSGLA